MIDILTSKWFWILVLFGSFLGLILALVIPSDYDRIKDSKPMYICQYDSRFSDSAPGFKNVNNEDELKEYINLIKDKSNLGPKSLTGVGYNTTVYVYDQKPELNLSQIIVKNDNPNYGQASIRKFWISDTFLSLKACK